MKSENIDETVLELNSGKDIVYLSVFDSIESLPLTNRSKNALKNYNINTIEQLLRISEKKLKTLRNVGIKSINEICSWKYVLKKSDGQYRIDISDNSKRKKISKIIYKDNGYVEDIALEDLHFSNRTMNALKPNGFIYFSDLFNKTEDDFRNLKSLGTKSIEEILTAISNQQFKISDSNNAKQLSYPALFIANISFYVSLTYQQLTSIAKKIEKQKSFTDYKDYCETVYASNLIKEAITQKIIYIISKGNSESISILSLQSKLPPDFVEYGLLDSFLKELKRKKIITINDDLISIKHLCLLDHLETLPNDRNSQILKERLSGSTLEEIGIKYGVTRERIRQLCKKLMDKFPLLEEDKFIPIYETYFFTKTQFINTFEVPVQTYYFLYSKSTVKKEAKKDFDLILEDNSIPKKIKKNASKLIYKDCMKINNTYILKRRPQVINYVIKTYCKQQTSFEDFLAIYKRIIDFAPAEDQESLSIDSERGYANRIADSKIALWGPHKTFRYYPIDEYDIPNFYRELNLQQYKDTEISTVKFIRDNKRLMREYDIQDEYELHNLLRKTWDEYGLKDISVDFSRMPHISIGNASREKQVTDLLFQNAPIKNTDLAELYEEEYGVSKASVLANFFQCIDKYYEGGFYLVEEKELSKEEGDFLLSYLKKDFYRLSTLKTDFTKNVSGADVNKLNAYNLKGFGYKLFSSYIVKDKFDSAASFFNYVLLKDEIIDESRMDYDLVSLGAYKAAVYNKLDEKVLYEFDEGKYININRLEKLGITKTILNKLLNEVECAVEENQFFTMYSLTNLPSVNIINDIAGFDTDAFFYDSLLTHEKNRFSSALVSGKHIFRKGSDQFQIEDVIKDILKEEKSMDYYDLQKMFKGKFNLDITLNRILKAAAESDLYFAGDYIYINYETYLEEF